MKPTKAQLKVLKFYAKYHAAPMTLTALVRAFSIAWLGIVAVACAALFLIWAEWPIVGWIYLGVSIGAFLRDVNRIIATLRVWPILHEVTNWERLDELIRTSEKEAY